MVYLNCIVFSFIIKHSWQNAAIYNMPMIGNIQALHEIV